jgi:transposase
MDKQEQLRSMLSAGWSVRRIREATRIHTKTIARFRRAWLSPPQSDSQVSAGDPPPVALCEALIHPACVQSDPQVSAGPKADPLRPGTRSDQLSGLVDVIAALLEISPSGSAQWIWQKLVENHDYRGSERSIRRYVHKIRRTTPTLFLRLQTKAGQQAQVDYAQGPMVMVNGKVKRSWFFKMTLSHSRHSYEEVVLRQDVESFIRCHESAFASFGGVPAETKIDNLKSGVLQAHLYEPQLNVAYQAFANHAGFVIHPCDAYQPQQKGKVERDVRYTRHNAFEGVQVLASVEEGNRLLADWNQRWARQRIHGTTRRQVWERFQSEELPALKPLPNAPFSMLHQGLRRVDVHGYVQIEGSFYSVPARLLRQTVVVRWDARMVRIIVEETVVAEHRREHGKAKIVTQEGHLPQAMTGGDGSFVRYYLERAAKVGPCCLALVERLMTGPNAGSPLGVKQARGIILDLQRRHGSTILEQACDKAGAIRIPSWKTLNTICQNLSDADGRTPPDPSPDPGSAGSGLQQEHRLIRDPGEYAEIARTRIHEANQ